MMVICASSIRMGKDSLRLFDKEFSKAKLKGYENSKADAIDSKILNDLYMIHKKAGSIVCSKECKCPGNPYLFQGNKDVSIDQGKSPCDLKKKYCYHFSFATA
jgi:hypothetical protein